MKKEKKISLEFISKILKRLPKQNTYLYGNAEFSLQIKAYTYSYDFYCTETKKIVEFHGDYFHANPKLYSHDDIIKCRGHKYKAGDIWRKNYYKVKNTIEFGYEIYVVWEDEYKHNKKRTIENALEFLLKAN